MKHISSRHNPLVARYRAVARGEDRTLVLLDGLHLVVDALAAHVPIVQAAVTPAALDSPDVQALANALTDAGAEVVEATAPVMDVLSPVRSASPIVALADRPLHSVGAMLAHREPVLVAACGVQDPGNMGALVRVAEAGAATGVIAAGQSADPFGWKALRGSMGSALRLPVAAAADLTGTIAGARAHACRIVAAVPRGGQPPDGVRLDGPLLLLIGGEGQGLTPELLAAADDQVTIPMAAPVESLNTAVCTALLVYEARRQRQVRHSPHGLVVPGRA